MQIQAKKHHFGTNFEALDFCSQWLLIYFIFWSARTKLRPARFFADVGPIRGDEKVVQKR